MLPVRGTRVEAANARQVHDAIERPQNPGIDDPASIGRAMEELWQCPDDAVAALVLAHGAGAGMTHRNMRSLADAFAAHGIATLRFNFGFIETKRNRVDSPAVAIARIGAAFRSAAARTRLPLWLGGHSYGGRMASHAVVEGLAPAGLVFCSFPLHAAGKPSVERAAHLAAIRCPMLFLSGTRDALATPELLERVVGTLPSAKLHWLDTADHGYRVLKRARADKGDVFDEIGSVARAFVDRP
jgi:predicted alpha/beta-hydrolase family hydrolase